MPHTQISFLLKHIPKEVLLHNIYFVHNNSAVSLNSVGDSLPQKTINVCSQ
jgi:hypothetical protein